MREERTKLISSIIIRILIALLLHLETVPQPRRVVIVLERDGVLPALEVVEAGEHGALGTDGLGGGRHGWRFGLLLAGRGDGRRELGLGGAEGARR